MVQVNLVALLLVANSAAQEPKPAVQPDDSSNVNASLNELQSEVRKLKDLVQQLKQETTASRAEITKLRQELESDRVSGSAQSASGAGRSAFVAAGNASQVDVFGNRGKVDSIDVPTLAYPQSGVASSGSLGGTLRQSIFGFEVFGPQLIGAKASGNVNFDAGGGFPNIYNGVNSGLLRLRTATMRLDWKNTDVVAGQDQLFFSPNSPTSFASLIVPPLAYSGNLWAWMPQMRIEHRIAMTEKSTFTVQGGILDNLTGEPPYINYTWYRAPQAGERARQPTYAVRVAYSHPLFGHTFTIGTAGYYSRQNWGYGRNLNGYAAMADWNLPLDRWFTLSGSFYRGQAIGGLGGGIGLSVLYNGPLTDPNTSVLPLNTVGGWAQLKYRPTSKLEFNAAFGQDNPFASDVREFSAPQSYGDPTLTRNQGAFGNLIYRPRSDLLFSLEYRRLSIYDENATAGQVNLGMGILF